MRLIIASLMAAVILAGVASGCQTLTGKSLGQNVDDTTITASVKTKLVGDRALNLTRVNVDTNQGTVYLIGTVENAEQVVVAEPDVARDALKRGEPVQGRERRVRADLEVAVDGREAGEPVDTGQIRVGPDRQVPVDGGHGVEAVDAHEVRVVVHVEAAADARQHR